MRTAHVGCVKSSVELVLRKAGIQTTLTVHMFSNDLTLSADEGLTGGTDADKVFVFRNLDGGNSERVDNSLPPATPRTLKISHETSKSTGVIVDRHLVRIDQTIAGDSSNPVSSGYCYVVIGVPRTTTWTSQHTKDVVGLALDVFNVTDVVTKLANGES